MYLLSDRFRDQQGVSTRPVSDIDYILNNEATRRFHSRCSSERAMGRSCPGGVWEIGFVAISKCKVAAEARDTRVLELGRVTAETGPHTIHAKMVKITVSMASVRVWKRRRNDRSTTGVRKH